MAVCKCCCDVIGRENLLKRDLYTHRCERRGGSPLGELWRGIESQIRPKYHYEQMALDTRHCSADWGVRMGAAAADASVWWVTRCLAFVTPSD